MGAITVKKRGKTWEYGFEVASVGGKRKRKTKGGFTRKVDAEKAGVKAKSMYDNTGQTISSSDLSISDYLDYWLESYVKTNLDPDTLISYTKRVRIHIKPDLGHFRLRALTAVTIQDWINSKKELQLSRGYISTLLACLSGALHYAVIPCQYIAHNPCVDVRMPKMKENKERKEKNQFVCMGSDFDALIERFKPGTSHYMPIMLGYNLGTRIGETYGFDLLEDIDWDKMEISINHQLKKVDGNWCLRPPKYDSYRTIKMGFTIADVLKKELKIRRENMLRYGQYYLKTYLTPDGQVVQLPAGEETEYKEIMPSCVRENGQLQMPTTFEHCVRIAKKELNMPLFHSHCLRHTHGTIMAEGGAKPNAVQERLGHRNVATTLQEYVFNTAKMQQEAVDVFEEATKKPCLRQ